MFLSTSAYACPDINGLTDRNCDKRLIIVCFGDSITFGRGDATGLGYPGRLKILFPDIEVFNLGVPGENTTRGRVRLQNQLPLLPKADYVIILQGVNDYWAQGSSVANTLANLRQMKNFSDSTGASTYIANLTAINRTIQAPWVQEVNRALVGFARIDFFSLGKSILSGDSIHPSGEGYQLMAQRTANFLTNISLTNKFPDLDGDGIYDFAEPRFGASPALFDTDGDGISDGDEVFKYGTDPSKVDTDGDGFSDHYEIFILGSDPLNPAPSAPTITDIKVVPLQ